VIIKKNLRFRSLALSCAKISSQEALTGGIIIAFLSLVILLSLYLNLWVDEFYSLESSNGDWNYVLSRALFFEMRPPLYFLLLKVWRSINSSFFFARLLSILLIGGSIWLFAGASKRYLKNLHPAITTAIIAFNPLTIYTAIEIRVYALEIFITILLTIFFIKGFVTNENKASARWCYFVISVVALYTDYFLGFLLFGNGCALLALRRWKHLSQYLGLMALAGIFFVPMLPVLKKQMMLFSVVTDSLDTNVGIRQGLVFIYRRFIDYLLPKDWKEGSGIVKGLRIWIFRVGVVFAFAYALIIWRRIDKVAYWLVITIGTICLFFVGLRNIVGLAFLRNYHTIVLYVPVILLVLKLVDTVNKRLISFIVIGTIFIFYGYSLYLGYYPLAKAGDWKRVADYIVESENENQSIFVFRNEGLLCFRNYYEGNNLVFPIPDEADRKRYDLRNQRIQNAEQLRNTLIGSLGDNSEFWLVVWGKEPYLGIDFNTQVLEEFLKENATEISKKEFYGTEVYHMKSK
jgi:uncharacterized membrane protein